MGSLEAYFMALLFAIAGSSVWTLRAEPILLSLVLVWLTWRLADALAETARLSPYAKQCFARLLPRSAPLSPPLYDLVVELRQRTAAVPWLRENLKANPSSAPPVRT